MTYSDVMVPEMTNRKTGDEVGKASGDSTYATATPVCVDSEGGYHTAIAVSEGEGSKAGGGVDPDAVIYASPVRKPPDINRFRQDSMLDSTTDLVENTVYGT